MAACLPASWKSLFQWALKHSVIVLRRVFACSSSLRVDIIASESVRRGSFEKTRLREEDAYCATSHIDSAVTSMNVTVKSLTSEHPISWLLEYFFSSTFSHSVTSVCYILQFFCLFFLNLSKMIAVMLYILPHIYIQSFIDVKLMHSH